MFESNDFGSWLLDKFGVEMSKSEDADMLEAAMDAVGAEVDEIIKDN